MPFKDFPEASTQYLDENGNLVAQLTGDELAKWKKHNENMMSESAEDIRERLRKQLKEYGAILNIPDIPPDPAEELKKILGVDEIIYDLQCAMITLSALFNNDHPEHDAYVNLDLKLNHFCEWGKIEDNLEQLIDDVIDFNTPDPEEYDEYD